MPKPLDTNLYGPDQDRPLLNSASPSALLKADFSPKAPDTTLYDPDQDGPLLYPASASALLKADFSLQASIASLAEKRVIGSGPPFIKIDGKVRYPERELRAWAADKVRQPILHVVPTSVGDAVARAKRVAARWPNKNKDAEQKTAVSPD